MVLELKRCVFEEKTEDGHGYFDDRPKDAGVGHPANLDGQGLGF
jgi:hypothetical protein